MADPYALIRYDFRHLYPPLQNYSLLLHFDIGTSKIEAAYAINADSNTDAFAVNPHDLGLQRNMVTQPTLIGVVSRTKQDAEFIIGHDVEYRLAAGRISHKHVWSNLKQNVHIMNPNDHVFADKKESLEQIQREHYAVLQFAKTFERITLHYPRGYTRTFYPNKAPGETDLDTFETTQDIFGILLHWTIDCAKLRLSSHSGISNEAMDQLFANEKVRIGVAVPDVLLPTMVTKYQKLLLDNGFGAHVEMLSEARCAAVKAAKDYVTNGSFLTDLGSEKGKHLNICDCGHGTTDMSTIKVIKMGAKVCFEFVVDSSGSNTGGKVVEDDMLQKIRKPTQSQSSSNATPTIVDDDFFDGFRMSIANEKHSQNIDVPKIFISNIGKGRAQNVRLSNNMVVNNGELQLPGEFLKASYDEFLAPLIPRKPVTTTEPTETTESTETTETVKAKKTKKIKRTTKTAGTTVIGLFEQHYNKLKYNNLHKSAVEHLVLGGAAIPDYVQQQLRERIGTIEFGKNAPVTFWGTRTTSYVAQGGIYMLSDKELRKRRFHAESIGCVVDQWVKHGSRDKYHPNTVVWLFKIGQRVDERSDFTHRYEGSGGFTITLNDPNENPQEVNFEYPVTFNWPVVSTDDQDIGQQDYPSADHPKITRHEDVVYDMNKEFCEHIGWTQDEAGFWKLDFEFELRVALDGNIVRCSFKVPERGRFQGAENFKTFESPIGARLSNLCHEDLFHEDMMDVDAKDFSYAP